jgi:hypothetical protein
MHNVSWRPSKSRMLARRGLALLLATVSFATVTAAENDSQNANSIMPIAQVGRGSTALGSNVFLAGECLGIVGTIL